MNHYLFKYAVEKSREIFLGKRVSSVVAHSNSLISFAFQKSNSLLFVDLSPQNSFLMPFSVTYELKGGENVPFFHFLKRNLVGLKLVGIEQKGSERVAIFVFEDVRASIVKRFNLIFEIMDRNSNAVFTDEKNVILQVYRYIDSQSRQLLPKKAYQPLNPCMPDLLDADLNKLILRFKHNEDILGFSAHLRRLVSDEDEFVELVKTIRRTFETRQFKLYLYPKDVVLPFYFRRAHKETDEVFLFDRFVARRQRIELNNRKRNLLKLLKRRLNSLSRRLAKIKGELNSALDYDKYRIYAENLMAHPNLNTAYLNSIEVNDVYTGKPIVIPLNPNLNLFGNAQVYFKKYKKAKKSVELIKKRIEETNQEIKFVNQLMFDAEKVSTNEELNFIINILIDERIVKSAQKRKQVKNFMPYEKVVIKGFDAYVGKNAYGNDFVTLKLSNKNDLWFHAKDRPSSHLVLKLPSKLKTLDDSVIIEAAKEVAKRSKAKPGEKVDVDYAFVKDVRKPKGMKPGLVLYRNFKTVTVKVDEHS